MEAPFAGIEQHVVSKTNQILSNAVITRTNGAASFTGIFDSVDEMAFEMGDVKVGTHILVYLDQPCPLADDERITVDQAVYRVMNTARIESGEWRANLMQE